MSKAPRYDVPNAAPDDLRLVQLFVNTSDESTLANSSIHRRRFATGLPSRAFWEVQRG